jgi:anaerobic selenocysteine-containing dehydrogenase
MSDRIAHAWGKRTPFSRDGEWPERVDMQLAPSVEDGDVDRWVQSACVLCSNGCALDIAVKDGRMTGVRGRGGDRVNRGRLGPKGLFGWQANQATDRLQQPLLRQDGELRPVDWDTALLTFAERMKQILRTAGPGAIGVYNSGQLFLEEYYALGVLTKAGIGTNHVDGNTRLCTATAAQALKESFGADGQPGSYRDVDSCDALFLVGHNVAFTQTVLWSRMLDRLAGNDRPRLVVVDPRRTPVADEAEVHLAVREGTNLALLNAIVHEIITNEWFDRAYVDAHTVGFDELEVVVAGWTPERAAAICEIDAGDIVAAAEIVGTCERLLSTALQGVYQSHQSTASACQINNLHLLRGMLGRPGCAVLQMNGQPTAQNARECGTAGDLPGFRNWQNKDHVAQLADLWNVDAAVIPSWAPPTHAMEIFRYAEQGSIELLWIIATNPAVSLPDLGRIRSILEREQLFVVVQDAFLTETASLADLVLPAALWAEKTGTFTNADRTVHLSEQAIDPPDGARSDLDIFLGVAKALDVRDNAGHPLLPWAQAEEVYAAWQACSRGRPCDYSEITYERLRAEGGIQWGDERLYTDGVFHTRTEDTEDFGHDLLTGAAWTEQDHRALAPDGRARLRATQWRPPPEEPDDEYPLWLTTGRGLHHFHTRTKTGRAPQLVAAAPDVWVEVSAQDAIALEVQDGDEVRVESRRGFMEARVCVGPPREGLVFIPFHYGWWDDDTRPHAANELTLTVWDPTSRQPMFKSAAVRITKVRQ